MFHMLPRFSPVKQDFIWVAEYADGTHLSEFDFSTHEENSFYEIKRDMLIRFGLIGHGGHFYFEGFGGSFKIVGQMFDFVYSVNGKNYPLSGYNQMYNDIITYKDAEMIADLKNGRSVGRITQFNFGYKTRLAFDDVNFGFKVIFQIPYKDYWRFNVRLVSDIDLDGKLLIRRNGQFIKEYDAPLHKDVGGEVTCLLK